MQPIQNQFIRTYTPAEVARIFGVKKGTVYAWLSRMELRGTKVNGRQRISELDLKSFTDLRNGGDFVDRRYAPK